MPTVEPDVLLKDICAFTDTLLATIGRAVEMLYAKNAEDELSEAVKSWAIFSNIMMLDFADSTLLLVRSNKLRGAQPLARSIYEFFITLVYFERHRDLALQQLQTVSGRRLLKATRGPFLTENERQVVVDKFEDWKKLVAEKNLDAYSGNRKFQAMAFEVEGETEQNHPTYATRYGIPSMFAHPDSGAIPDVIIPNEDGTSISVAWRSHTIDARMLIASINDILLRLMLFMKTAFDCAAPTYDHVFEMSHALSRRLIIAKGLDPSMLD